MALAYRMPVSTLMRSVPAWDVALMSAFLAREPTPEERIEMRIAEFVAMWSSSKKQPGSEPDSPEDFMPHRRAWKPEAELPPEDLALMSALRNRRH